MEITHLALGQLKLNLRLANRHLGLGSGPTFKIVMTPESTPSSTPSTDLETSLLL
ncbi:hypothetical protein C0J52_06201 [Blattella germanica]|nr:hypothetical protein C0J52_06201 [Blattella germanica]